MERYPRGDLHPDPPAGGAIDRRRFLTLGAGAVAAAGVGALAPGAAPAAAGPSGHGGDPYGFALLGDTQIDVDVPARTEWVGWVYDQIAAADPPVVCHVGDIVEHGSTEEYDTYLGAIPAGLRSRVRHVPGNHEWRWDHTAGERYRKLFGPARYSFDAGGMHFVGLDPSHLLQEPGGFGEPGIRWLTRDLDRVRPGVPVILMCHFPFGGDNYYVSDQERLLEVVAAYNVRAVFAGHIHAEQINRLQGATQFTVDDARGGPVYYWLERTRAGQRRVLQVTAVTRGDDGSARTRPVVEIPLTGSRAGLSHRPQSVRVDPQAGALSVAVRLSPHAGQAQVTAQLHPQHTYGTKDAGDWHPLAGDGRRFTGSLDLSGLAPGRHRMTVKVSDQDGAWYEQNHEFTLPGDAADRVRWRRRLDAPVQAGLAARDGLVVAATTAGTVVAGRPTGRTLRHRWRARLGPVYGRPAFSPDGGTLYVPSADHTLYALDPATGRRRFAYDAGEPVLGSPLVTEVGGRTVVVVTAGETRHAVDGETGRRLWTARRYGIFAGRAAGDGQRVFTGAGDGNAYAFDAATGEELWSFATNDRTGTYQRLIYGAWYDTLEVLAGGLVLVSNVTDTYALDPATGVPEWSLGGSYGYAPKTLLEGGDLLMIDDWRRTMSRVDGGTGELRWTADLGARALNTGAAVHAGTAWVPTTTGRLVAVDVATGDVRERTQLTTTAYCYSPPVVASGMLLAGDQDGVLHGVALEQ